MWPILSTNCVVIACKMTASTSQPVAFIGQLSILGHLTGLRNKPQKKTDKSMSGSGVVLIS